jgi:hypothetical protein
MCRPKKENEPEPPCGFLCFWRPKEDEASAPPLPLSALKKEKREKIWWELVLQAA